MARLLPLLLAFLLVTGCDEAPEGLRPDRLVLMLGDEGTGRNPGTVLFVRTEEQYPCAGYRLPLEVQRSGTVVRLKVGRVQGPEGDACATVLMPAQGQTSLGLSDGTYTLRVESAGRTDTYRLIVEKERTRLEAVAATFTRAEVFPEG